MMIKSLRYISILLLSTFALHAQDDANRPAVGLEILSHNMLKYNKNIINPAFSALQDESTISAYHRRQWGVFNVFPEFYYLGYSGTLGSNMGVGIGAFQQNIGVFSNTGAILNYAYSVRLSDENYLTVGLNTTVYMSGINGSNVISYPDPALTNLENNFIINAQPGINLSIGDFDVGVYAENIFDYNISVSEMLTEFGEKTFSGHLQYKYTFDRLDGIFEDATLTSLVRARKQQEETSFSGGFIFDAPRAGWFQLGYESIYGASAGIGFNLLENSLSLGYVVEKGLGDGLKDFGLTHEFLLAYAFNQSASDGRNDRVARSRRRRATRRRPITRPTPPVVQAPPTPPVQEQPEIIEETPPVNNDQPTVADILNAREQPVSEETPPVVEETPPPVVEETPPVVEETPPAVVEAPQPPVVEETPPQAVEQDSLSLAIAQQNEQTIRELENARNEFVNEDDLEQIALQKASELYGADQGEAQGIEGVQSGYYIISNTYITERYLNTSINRLKAEGIEADYFFNPKDSLHYVYLGRYDSMEGVLEYYKNNQEIAFNNRTTVYKVENDDQSDVVKDKENVAEVRQVIEVPGMESGYYMVSHVFAIPENAEYQLEQMRARGLNVNSFVNPKNLYIYIYLESHGTFEEAKSAFDSNLNNTYDREILIMSVNQE